MKNLAPSVADIPHNYKCISQNYRDHRTHQFSSIIHGKIAMEKRENAIDDLHLRNRVDFLMAFPR